MSALLEPISAAIAAPGFHWIVLITLISGLVYGFAGFGAGLVFMPVAVVFVSVEVAVAAFSLSAVSSAVTLVPRAWKQCNKSASLIMITSALVTVPLGLWTLRSNDVTTMRWAVLAVTTITLIALITGWRYKTEPKLATRTGVGLAAGFLGGSTGLLGPIMVLLQLSGQDSAQRSRANTLVFLSVTSTLTLPIMWLMGMLGPQAIALGILLCIPYGVGGLLGQRLFDPAREALYRNTAYAIIAAAIIMGLPIYE